MPAYKNRFASPEFIEEVVVDDNDKKVGTIRVKPSSILWKPSGQQKFYSVTLKDFTDWITKKPGVTRTDR